MSSTTSRDQIAPSGDRRQAPHLTRVAQAAGAPERRRAAARRHRASAMRDAQGYLMDDPISALDARLREEMRVELACSRQTRSDALVGELSGGQQQGVAIARAMYFKSKVLILDEPTNQLSVKETNKVIGFVKALKSQGVTAIFISHNMYHVFQCCDRVVAMARGEIVFNKPVAKTSIDEVAEYM